MAIPLNMVMIGEGAEVVQSSFGRDVRDRRAQHRARDTLAPPPRTLWAVRAGADGPENSPHSVVARLSLSSSSGDLDHRRSAAYKAAYVDDTDHSAN